MLYTSGMSLPVRVGAIFILFLVCHQGLSAEAQWQGQPLQDYIAWLVEQDFAIIYSSDLVLAEYIVREEPANPNSVAALRKVLQPYRLALADGPGNRLLIVEQESSYGSIVLTVKEAGADFMIAAARLLIDGKTAGQTDENGGLTATDNLPGTYKLAVVAAGYTDSDPRIISLEAGQTLAVEVELQALPQSLPEIVVTSSLYSLTYNPAGFHTFLDRELTTKLPDIGDEAVRSIDRLPGSANGGVSTRSHIRGGVNNEQLFLFDGLRLYEPYHLKDFHSPSTIIDQNAIAGIDFYSAGYQVRYGDRMSGVVDISMRGPASDILTEIGLSFFNSFVLTMGRFGNESKGDWLITARRGNLDLVADAVNSDYGTPRYEDAFMHIGWELSERTSLSGNLLLSYDKITLNELDGSEHASARYRNRVAWLKAETDWTAAVSSSTILSLTQIDNARLGLEDIPDIAFGNVDDNREFRSVALKQDWQFNVSGNWLLSTGFDVKRLEADYEYDSVLNILPPFDQILDNQPLVVRSIRTSPRGAQYGAYLESRWRVLDNLVIDAGIRWDQQTYTTANDDKQFSPRLNLLYRLGDRTELRFGIGQFYQAQEINELQVADGVATFFPAQRARHVVASLSHELTSGIDVRVELYHKKYRSLMPRYENVFDPLVLIPELQIDRARIDSESAVSKGAELMVTGESEAGNLLWWGSYSWSVIEDSLPGGSVKRSWDQSHTVKAGINWDWRKWSFSSAGSVHTGWPRTDLIIETITDPDGSTTLLASTTPRNSLRHSVFHSVDVRASRRFDVGKGELTGFLEITNIYDRQNPCCTKYRIQTDGDGDQVLSSNEGSWLPLFPSLGVIWRF